MLEVTGEKLSQSQQNRSRSLRYGSLITALNINVCKGSSILYVQKVFKNTNISYNLTHIVYQEVRNVSVLQNFAYVLNVWSLMNHLYYKEKVEKELCNRGLGNSSSHTSFSMHERKLTLCSMFPYISFQILYINSPKRK